MHRLYNGGGWTGLGDRRPGTGDLREKRHRIQQRRLGRGVSFLPAVRSGSADPQPASGHSYRVRDDMGGCHLYQRNPVPGGGVGQIRERQPDHGFRNRCRHLFGRSGRRLVPQSQRGADTCGFPGRTYRRQPGLYSVDGRKPMVSGRADRIEPDDGNRQTGGRHLSSRPYGRRLPCYFSAIDRCVGTGSDGGGGAGGHECQ